MVSICRPDKRVNYYPTFAMCAFKSARLLFLSNFFVSIFSISRISITFHASFLKHKNQQKPSWLLDRDYFNCAFRKRLKDISKKWPAKQALLLALGLAQWLSDVVYLPYIYIIPLKL